MPVKPAQQLAVAFKRPAQSGGTLLACVCVLLAASSLPASAAPTWTESISFGEAPEAQSPQVAVAMDARGDSVVAWCQSVGANESIEAVWRPAGGTFSAPVEVSPPAQEAIDPIVAMDSQGDATVAWLSRRIGSYLNEGFVEAASRPANGSFEPAEEVGKNYDDEGPAIAMDAHGDATVAWLQYSTGGSFVQAASRPPDGAFGKEFTVSSSAPLVKTSYGHEATAPALSVNPAGDIVIAWAAHEIYHEEHSSPSIMELRTQQTGGALGPALTLMSESESTPRLAIDEGGEIAIAWVRGAFIEETSLSPSSEAFGSPAVVSNPNAAEEGIHATSPAVAVDGAGEAVVAWLYGTKPAARAFHLGGSMGQPVELAKPGTEASDPVLAMGLHGDSMVMWISEHEGTPAVEGAARPAGGQFGQPSSLAAAGKIRAPVQTALDAQGDAVSAWTVSDGTHEFIQVAGYQATGPQMEALQVPSEGIAGAGIAFSVSPQSVWSNVASTTWSWGDGSPDTPGASAIHTFDVPGRYQVVVSATDTLGNTTTAALTITIHDGEVPQIPEKHKSSTPSISKKRRRAATAAFKPYFGIRPSIGGSIVGLLVTVAEVRGIASGDTLVIRCIAACEHPLHQAIRIGRHHHPHGELILTKPLVLHRSTRIEVDLQAPDHVTRYVRYRFVRTSSIVRPYPTRKGCLSPAKRPESCPTKK